MVMPTIFNLDCYGMKNATFIIAIGRSKGAWLSSSIIFLTDLIRSLYTARGYYINGGFVVEHKYIK